jgi:hypothetical protein
MTTVTKLPDGQIVISTPQRHLTFPTQDVFCGELARLYPHYYQPGGRELQLVMLVQEAVFHSSAKSGMVEVADLVADMDDRLGSLPKGRLGPKPLKNPAQRANS